MSEKLMNKDAMIKEIRDLGILNISPSGYLSKEVVSDAINAVKSTDIDFDKIAEKMKADFRT